MKKEILKNIGWVWGALIGMSAIIFGIAYISSCMEKKYGEPTTTISLFFLLFAAISVAAYVKADE